MSGKTTIQYYIPEDGDDLDHPNILLIEKEASKITLGDIRKVFPIPGTYYFRFKRSFKKNWIWFDVQNESDVVPCFEGSIVCKVTRLPAKASEFIYKSSTSQKAKPSPKPTPTKKTTPIKSTPSTSSTESNDFFSSFTTPTEAPKETSNNNFDPFSYVDTPKTQDPFASLQF